MRALWLWGPVVGFIVAVLTIPGRTLAPVNEAFWDKGNHFAAYAVFGFCCLRAFHGGLHPLRTRPTVAGLAAAFGFAIFDEWQQSLRPGRFSSVLDALADSLGIVLALLIFAACVSMRRHRKEQT